MWTVYSNQSSNDIPKQFIQFLFNNWFKQFNNRVEDTKTASGSGDGDKVGSLENYAKKKLKTVKKSG